MAKALTEVTGACQQPPGWLPRVATKYRGMALWLNSFHYYARLWLFSRHADEEASLLEAYLADHLSKSLACDMISVSLPSGKAGVRASSGVYVA
jgi:hypothetical protein